MDLEKVLIALKEQRKWERREADLKVRLKLIHQQKKNLLIRLEMEKKEMAYYDSMVTAMKESVHRVSVRTAEIRTVK